MRRHDSIAKGRGIPPDPSRRDGDGAVLRPPAVRLERPRAHLRLAEAGHRHRGAPAGRWADGLLPRARRHAGACVVTYEAFLGTKRTLAPATGLIVAGEPHELLFPFPRELVRWAVRKGRAALFADTGLGKTLMQIEWARLIGERTLIIAPLSVARQTVHEATKVGVTVTYSRGAAPHDGITITNYEMVEHFDPSEYGAVVLDESSILKALDGKTRRRLT